MQNWNKCEESAETKKIFREAIISARKTLAQN